MKHLARWLLCAGALALGGGLGHLLLPGFDALKWMLFFAACMVLGKVFYQIDKKLLR